MGKEVYVSPELGLKAFNCPSCRAYSQQEWHEIQFSTNGNVYNFNDLKNKDRVESIKVTDEVIVPGMNNYRIFHITSFSRCYNCKSVTIWRGGNMVYPQNLNVEPPNLDMPKEIASLYDEARSIAHLSPRSAAGLLRLALEKLLIHLGAKKGTIDIMIQDLVDKNIISSSGHVRLALDSIRVIGNAGVHSTDIDLEENPQAAFALFKVLNFVVEKMITETRVMEEIYSFIPDNKREKLDIKRETNRSH